MAITQQGGIDRAESNRRRQAFLAWCDSKGYYHHGANRYGQIAYRVGSKWYHTNADRWLPGEYEDLDPTDSASVMRCIRRMTNRVESTRIP